VLDGDDRREESFAEQIVEVFGGERRRPIIVIGARRETLAG
jgi:hypothetical protein